MVFRPGVIVRMHLVSVSLECVRENELGFKNTIVKLVTQLVITRYNGFRDGYPPATRAPISHEMISMSLFLSPLEHVDFISHQ